MVMHRDLPRGLFRNRRAQSIASFGAGSGLRGAGPAGAKLRLGLSQWLDIFDDAS